MILQYKKNRFPHSVRTGAAAAAGLVFFVICGAFVLVLAAAVSPLFSGGNSTGGGYKQIFSLHVLSTAFFTLKVAVGSTIVATAVGIPAAFYTANRQFPGRTFLLSLSAVPLCIPALLVALGFVSFLGMGGTCNRVLMLLFHLKDPPIQFLYSFRGIILAQGFYNFPLVMGTVSSCWEQLPQEESDAARLLGAGEFRIFRTITLYQLSGAIASACILVFLYSFFSFMIVLLFGNVGGSTLEVEIYQAARTTLNFREASSLALFETVCAMSVVAAYSMLDQRPSMSSGLSFSNESRRRYRIGKRPYRSDSTETVERAGAVLVFGLITFFFLAPFAGIILSGLFEAGHHNGIHFTFRTFGTLLRSAPFRSAVWNTLRTAAATGIFSVITAFVYACIVRYGDPDSRHLFLKTVPLLPMAVSSTVTGFGMTLLVHSGSPAVLVAAQTMLTWPLAFRQIYPVLNRLPRETEDAARLLSPYRIDTPLRLYLPFSRQGIVAAFGFCFAVSCGDTTLPLVLSLPHFDTLSLYTYRLASSYRFSQACACGTLLGILCAGIFAAAGKIGKKYIRQESA